MLFETEKFGRLQIDPDRILLFPDGLLGFESHRHWALLADHESDAVGWLQSLSDGAVAVSVVTPQRFVPDYHLRLHSSEIARLPWSTDDRMLVLAIVSKNQERLTLNLRAPLVVNIERCVGRQVITQDDQPLRYVLPEQFAPLRKSA